jgi:predicted GIY-YIG superfamily endonuclease
MANKTLRDNEKQFYIYIMTNKYKRVLYVGVTSSLQERIYEHRTKMEPGFTSRYNLSKLVYYEELADSGSDKEGETNKSRFTIG